MNIEIYKLYMTNIEQIDKEHKIIIDVANKILTSGDYSEKERMNFLNTTTNELISCSLRHFETEENIMIASSYPKLTEHKNWHKSFIDAMFEVMQNYLKTKEIDYKDLYKFMRKWLTEHVSVQDRHFAEYYHKIKSEKM